MSLIDRLLGPDMHCAACGKDCYKEGPYVRIVERGKAVVYCSQAHYRSATVRPVPLALLGILVVLMALSGCTGQEGVKFGSWGTSYYPSFLTDEQVGVSQDSGQTIVIFEKNLSVLKTACTGSMTPMFGCRNTILYEGLEPGAVLHIGDVVVLEADNRTMVHQIIGVGINCFYTKGTNAIFGDGCIPRDRITGRVWVVLPTVEQARGAN